jgi:DNA-binding transcriptional MocR family regulator
VLQIIESLGLKALEIPTHPREGISLEALQVALEQTPVQACLLTPTFNNPLGSCMSDERKKKLVEMLAAREIPLIEDDIWGDTSFHSPRPKAAKAWDKNGGVMLCSSFSKTVAPGLRAGYVAAGRWTKRVEYLKTVTSLANTTLTSLALAEFLQNGGYDAHLRRVRKTFGAQMQWTIEAIDHYFPNGTRVTRPRGGQVVWVELDESVDSLELFAAALKEGISIAPGPLFSPRSQYKHFIRLNCGYHQSPDIEKALETLGKLASKQM